MDINTTLRNLDLDIDNAVKASYNRAVINLLAIIARTLIIIARSGIKLPPH